MKPRSPYVSLHNHTELGSPLDGMNDVHDLFVRAKEIEHAGVAVSDHGNLTAIFDAWKASKKTGVKLVPGEEFYFTTDLSTKKNNHMVILAQNAIGYKNLLRLAYESFKNQSIGYMSKKTPRITWRHLEQWNEGLFVLTACSNGLIAKTLITEQDEEKAICHIRRLHSIFRDNLFLEIQPHALVHVDKKGREVNQPKLNQAMIRLSRDMDIPYVITCDAHYRDASHAKYHDFMLAVKDRKALDDEHRFRYGVQDMYLKTHEEIIDFFGKGVAEIGMANSVRILDACDEPTYLEPKGTILPKFPVHQEKNYWSFKGWDMVSNKKNIPEDQSYLRYRCIEGFKEKVGHLPKKDKKLYWERVKKELAILEDKDFSSYMLIVADFVRWAKENNVPVGTGRGSVGGCVIAYLIGITGVDSIKYGLIFERFHNAQKTATPDIDLDFASPDKVKQYIREKYGHENVASISNFSTLSPKVAIKDAARSLRLGGDKSSAFEIANHLTKIMPDEKSIDKAMKADPEFAEALMRYPKLHEYATRLEGLTRNWGVHAAGIVMADQPLYELIPLRIEQGDINDPSTWTTVTQWEKNRCEDFGLVKMDCLGLKTMTVLDNTLKTIKEVQGKEFVLEDIPLDDKETYDMIGRGETSGVFQLEASLTPFCIKIKPKNIEGISAINALGRPSCLPETREIYIDRVLGKEKVKYGHPNMKRGLEKTQGILLYEESAMYIAEDVAGWNLNQADALRKLSKLKGKDPELAAKTETDFIRDSMEHSNMAKEEAVNIWKRWIEPMSGYSFNKAHSIAYSHISYYTAWMRCHYPTEFMCALLNSKDPNSDESLEHINNCRLLGIKITPPNIMTSNEGYTVSEDKIIATGFSALKGVGAKAIIELVQAKPDNLVQFFARTKGRILNKTVMGSLAKAGVFDCWGISRKSIFDNYAKYRTKVNNTINKAKKEYWDAHLEALSQAEKIAFAALPLKIRNARKKAFYAEIHEQLNLDEIIDNINFVYTEEEWSRKEILLNELDVFGRTISGPIHEIFPGFFRKGNPMITPLSKIQDLPDKKKIKVEIIIKGLIKELTIKNGQNKGKKFGKYLVEDAYGNTAHMTLWSFHYGRYRRAFETVVPIKAICKVSDYQGKKDINLSVLENISGRRVREARY